MRHFCRWYHLPHGFNRRHSQLLAHNAPGARSTATLCSTNAGSYPRSIVCGCFQSMVDCCKWVGRETQGCHRGWRWDWGYMGLEAWCTCMECCSLFPCWAVCSNGIDRTYFFINHYECRAQTEWLCRETWQPVLRRPYKYTLSTVTLSPKWTFLSRSSP